MLGWYLGNGAGKMRRGGGVRGVCTRETVGESTYVQEMMVSL